MRAILLSLGLIFSVQSSTYAEEVEGSPQPHIYDCAGALSDDKNWIEADLANYARGTGIRIFLITGALKNEHCDEMMIRRQEELKKKSSNTVLITLMSTPEKYWVEVTPTADLTQRFGLVGVMINLDHKEKALQAAGKALIEASDLVRNHFTYGEDAAALLNGESADDPYGSDVTTPLQETAPIEPSDIPPDEGDGDRPNLEAPKKPFRPEGQPI